MVLNTASESWKALAITAGNTLISIWWERVRAGMIRGWQLAGMSKVPFFPLCYPPSSLSFFVLTYVLMSFWTVRVIPLYINNATRVMMLKQIWNWHQESWLHRDNDDFDQEFILFLLFCTISDVCWLHLVE